MFKEQLRGNEAEEIFRKTVIRHAAVNEVFDGLALDDIKDRAICHQALAGIRIGAVDQTIDRGVETAFVKPPFYVPLSDRVSGIGGRMFRA